MISLETLAALAAAHADDLGRPVEPLRIKDRVLDTDTAAAVMGVVNLSPDSTYRSSIAPSTADAITRGRVLAAQGADVVDVGAESTTLKAERISPADQIARLVPVVEALAAEDVLVSTESYDVEVVRACLDAGAAVVNLTGSTEDDPVFELAAAHGAAVVLCHVEGGNSRELDGADLSVDALPRMLDGFARRLDRARELGVRGLVVDPGVGFHFGVPQTPAERLQYQADAVLGSFRLRRLGVAVCQSVPHGFALFQDEYRTGEAFFATLARLCGAGLVRTHEVPRVRPVLRALDELRG